MLRWSNREEGGKWISSNPCQISIAPASKAFPVYTYPGSLRLKKTQNKPKPEKPTPQTMGFIEMQRAGRKGFSWERGLSQGWWMVACPRHHAQRASNPPPMHPLLSWKLFQELPLCWNESVLPNSSSTQPYSFPPWIHWTFVTSHVWFTFAVETHLVCSHYLGKKSSTGGRPETNYRKGWTPLHFFF